MNDTVMWPMRLDMTRDECRKCLRCLELDAYGSMVSVLRAQGPFTNEKQRLLQELAKVLHISNERHRAEVRRAVNDEKLATIAEQLSGPNTGTDWTIEGRRTIPLLPRLKARSAFTTLANSLSLATAAANEKKPLPVNTEDIKDNEIESQIPIKLEERTLIDTEQILTKNNVNARKRPLQEIAELDKNEESDNEETENNHEHIDEVITSTKCKSPPLPTPPPNKVLIVSSGTSETLSHGIGDKISLENSIHVSHTAINVSQHQNVTLIPFSISCIGSSSTASKDVVAEGCLSNHTLVQSNKNISTTVSICSSNTSKPKTRITPQNKLSTKTTPTILLSSNVTSTAGNNVQSQSQDAQIYNSINTKVSPISHNSVKMVKSENGNSNTCVKKITPIIHSSTKQTTTTKSVISSDVHRVMEILYGNTICPGSTASSGPGPPQIKQTTATIACKKLSSPMLNHQSTAKMGVALNSNKTVNISHHPNTKLASKTNLIVIQKGHTKGVTLSHAGKEVLGKVIMGGKNLCVTNQHGASSVSVLPQHIALNNGDQAMVLSSVNSSHADSVKADIKSGNTIVFNLRQDVLEKNKVLSQLFESSSVLTSESKTVIQNASAHVLKEEDNSDSHLSDRDSSLKSDTVNTSVVEEKHHRKNKDVYANINSQVISSIDSSKSSENKEIFVNPSQLTSIQDDTVSNIQIEDSVCNSEIDMFDTSLGSTDISFENFQYLVEDNENRVLEETRSPLLSINRTNDDNDS